MQWPQQGFFWRESIIQRLRYDTRNIFWFRASDRSKIDPAQILIFFASEICILHGQACFSHPSCAQYGEHSLFLRKKIKAVLEFNRPPKERGERIRKITGNLWFWLFRENKTIPCPYTLKHDWWRCRITNLLRSFWLERQCESWLIFLFAIFLIANSSLLMTRSWFSIKYAKSWFSCSVRDSSPSSRSKSVPQVYFANCKVYILFISLPLKGQWHMKKSVSKP